MHAPEPRVSLRMNEHRSIQDIIPPARSHPLRRPPIEAETEGAPPAPPPTPPQPMRLKPERSWLAKAVLAAAVAIVVLGVGIGIASTLFHKAYVAVTPYRVSATVSESLKADPGGSLPYRKITVTDTATKTVAASGSEHVENHASGIVTVYNAYSTRPERLITNTRFETADGLIYRVHEPVVIPGYVIKAGVKVPGSADVTVYADQAGASYNVGLVDFTIPGLKGTKQYALMSARSKAPIGGGFIGEQAVIDPALRAQTVSGLQAALERSLRAKVANATLAGAIVFPDSVALSYAEGPDAVDGGNGIVSVSGTAVAPAFDENALAHELASSTQSSYQGTLLIDNPEGLSVNVSPAAAVSAEGPITLAISGSARLSAAYDPKALSADLAGKSKRDVQSILPKYPGIASLDVKIYPFWLSGLPGDPAKILVTDAPEASTGQ